MTYLSHYIYVELFILTFCQRKICLCISPDRPGYIVVANITPNFSSYMPKFGGPVPEDVHI